MSFIILSKEKVQRACTEYLNQRMIRINREHELLIQEQMSGWFKSKTRKKAIEKLQYGTFNDWDYVTIVGGYDCRIVKELLSLANISEDFVNVDAPAADILQNYFIDNSI